MQVNKIVSVFVFLFCSCSCFAQTKKLELPKFKSTDIIVEHTGHILSYNPEWMLPNWVAYELRSEELEGDAHRLKGFYPDPKLEGYVPAEHWHYTNTGWVRGHMIPAGDVKYSQDAMDDSFCTSNVCPMNMHFNNSIWKRLEEKARAWAVEYGYIYIVTGPIIGQNINGKLGVSDILIPDKFYKAFLIPYNGSYLAIAFVMDNAEETAGKLKDFAMSVDDLERIIDIDLFNNLDFLTELQVESQLPVKKLGLF